MLLKSDKPKRDDDISKTSNEENFTPSLKLTAEQEKEARVLADFVLESNLGEFAYLVGRYLQKPSVQFNTMSVQYTARASLRYGVSPAVVAAIATSYLKDLQEAGFISKDLSHLACDKSKLVRARKFAMKKVKEEDQQKVDKSGIAGIYFDGRRDNSLTEISDIRGKLHQRICKEEHVSVTQEPGGNYLSHFTPDEPTHPEKPAFKEAEALFELLDYNNAAESCLVIGGDSTASNTDHKGGVFFHLEKL